jgi:hypothetical protein
MKWPSASALSSTRARTILPCTPHCDAPASPAALVASTGLPARFPCRRTANPAAEGRRGASLPRVHGPGGPCPRTAPPLPTEATSQPEPAPVALTLRRTLRPRRASGGACADTSLLCRPRLGRLCSTAPRRAQLTNAMLESRPSACMSSRKAGVYKRACLCFGFLLPVRDALRDDICDSDNHPSLSAHHPPVVGRHG